MSLNRKDWLLVVSNVEANNLSALKASYEVVFTGRMPACRLYIRLHLVSLSRVRALANVNDIQPVIKASSK